MNLTLHPLLTGKYRCRTDIVATILTITQNGESPTKIMEKANLNPRRFHFYITALAKLGLIEIKYMDERKIYAASRKGIQYLTQYNALINLLK